MEWLIRGGRNVKKLFAILLMVSTTLLLLVSCSEKGENKEMDKNKSEQPKQESTPDQLAGDWNGFIDVQGNQLNILISFKREQELTGTISIPAQNLQNFPLSNININEEKVLFNMEIPNQKIEFSGEINDNQIKGTFSQQGQFFPFELNKGKVVTNEKEDDEVFMSIDTGKGELYGSLVLPNEEGPFPIVLIIPGSGPTDRNGNSALSLGKNDSLKMLANQLAEQGVASLRYDKRGAGKNISAIVPNKEVRFELFIHDAEKWIHTLKNDSRFSKVGVVGHSQGSLVGMLAAKNVDADAFVSIAGAGQSIDQVLEEQLSSSLPDELMKETQTILQKLRAGKTIPEVSEQLKSVFQPEIQPFLISWINYNPVKEIQKLNIPVLIINGDHDIQVSVQEAELLHQAKPEAKLLIVPNMNHVLKEAPEDRQENLKTYSDPSLPLADGLIDGITKFFKENNFLK